MTVDLKKANGEILLSVNLPDSPKDLPLVNYVSFLNEAAKMQMPSANAALIMARAVAEFTGQPLADVLTAEFGEEWQGSGQAVKGIRGLYGWCIKVIGNWQGAPTDECEFEFKGHVFHIPEVTTDAIAGHILPPLTTNESIEVLETVRIFEGHIEKSTSVRECVAFLLDDLSKPEKDVYEKRLRALLPGELIDVNSPENMLSIQSKHGDVDGNFSFSRYVRLLAILCRQKGELLPTGESEKRMFIADRMKLFQAIDTRTALDVDFFLLGTLSASGRTLPVIGTLIHPAFVAVVETKRLSAKRTPAPLNIKKMYSSALDTVH